MCVHASVCVFVCGGPEPSKTIKMHMRAAAGARVSSARPGIGACKRERIWIRVCVCLHSPEEHRTMLGAPSSLAPIMG